MIRDRVRSGMETAKAKGKKVGRPQITKENIPPIFYEHHSAFVAGTLNISEFARLCGLSSDLYIILDDHGFDFYHICHCPAHTSMVVYHARRRNMETSIPQTPAWCLASTWDTKKLQDLPILQQYVESISTSIMLWFSRHHMGGTNFRKYPTFRRCVGQDVRYPSNVVIMTDSRSTTQHLV